MLDLLICKAEVMLLLDLRLLLAKGIRMAAEGLLFRLCRLLFSSISLLLTVGAHGSVNTRICCVPKVPLQLSEGLPEVRWVYTSLRKSP